MNVPSGYTALDLIGFTDRGDYVSTDNYVKNDLVHYNGRVWLCLVDDTTGIAPVAGANWKVWIDEAAYLSGLADVTISNPANGEALRYNSQSGKWENVTVDSTPTVGSSNLVQSGGVATQLANKANSADLATVATSGDYQDLNNLPTLADVATTGQYSDLLGAPTIPTVNNGTLTIQVNGANVQTFGANESNNKTANVTVPTKTSDLTNDSNFVSDANYQHITVDSAFSDSSTNPVQNKVVNSLKETLTNEVTTRATLGSHNLLPIDLKTIKSLNTSGTWTGNVYQKNSVTFTITTDTNGDIQEISVSGTASASAALRLTPNIKSSYVNQKIMNGCNSGINTIAYYISQKNAAGSETGSSIRVYDGDTLINIDTETYPLTDISIYVGNGKTVSNEKFYPMLRLSSDIDTTYQPYAMTNKELTDGKANKSDLASINITGTTNNTGTTIARGTYFYLNGTLVKAKTAIENGATFTSGTNYEVANNGLNQILRKTVTATLVSGSKIMTIASGVGADKLISCIPEWDAGWSAIVALGITSMYSYTNSNHTNLYVHCAQNATEDITCTFVIVYNS